LTWFPDLLNVRVLPGLLYWALNKPDVPAEQHRNWLISGCQYR
jgi:hypothetical protein